jgi:two-component sensor histidine kinase
MKGVAFLKKIVISSWFLAFIPAILIMLFLHPLSSKYSLTVEPGDKITGQIVYADLNSDSISEMIYAGKGAPYFFISVRDLDLRFYDQWNLPDSFHPNLSEIFIGNYDHDRYKEIYVFTHKQDSLFLNVNEFFEPSGTKLERIFITKIGYLKGEVTSSLRPCGFFDEDGDGKDELYFGITTGFSPDPRRMYCFNIKDKSLKSSQFTGIIGLNPKMTDIDGDKRPEIVGTMSACGNFGSKVPYSDSSTWFMVFNDKLKFEFPPVEFPGYVNGLEIDGYDNGSFRGYVLSHWAGGADTTVLKSRIMIYSPDGKLISSRLYSDFGFSRYVRLFVNKYHQTDKLYVLGDKFLELNERLEVVNTINLPFHSNIFAYQTDLNADGEDEFLLYSEDEEELAVYSAGLQKMTELGFKTPDPLWKFSHYLSKNHEHKLFLSSGNSSYFFKLKRNNYYFLGYLAYPGIYILFFFFILLVSRINTYQVVQKESFKRRLITLQLQGIKAQLDPHFTFNTLNSVASLIYLEDRKTAYDYMNKFTSLLRGMLNDAERIYRSLGEELEFVTTYLDLEKLRFGDRLSYKIEIGEGVSQSDQVPKLVLHTFAENAVKHGILPSEKGGMIKIRINREMEYLKLVVEDNGIGRAKAEGHSTSTGKGLKITGEFYDILNQLNKKPIKHLITDLYNETGDPAGTKVEVWVPTDDG